MYKYKIWLLLHIEIKRMSWLLFKPVFRIKALKFLISIPEKQNVFLVVYGHIPTFQKFEMAIRPIISLI